MNDVATRQRPPLIPGIALWSAFALAALLLRGVRWDENFEFAQAMNPAFGYPDGHPLVVYTRGAYNAQIHFSAFLARITDNAAFLNGFRNFAFILATVLPPFLLGAVASGRAWAGHVCVLLVLAGIHLEFDGVYPQFVWPGMFSNGHIGTGFALATLAVFAGGYVRTASLMLGLMPMIHLGQAPPLMLLAAAYGIDCGIRKEWRELLGALPYLGVGLLACALFYVAQRAGAVPAVTSGSYAAGDSSTDIWRSLVTHYDMHRQIPVGNSHLIPLLMAPLALSGWGLPNGAGRVWNWLCGYAAGAAAIVYGTIAFQMLLGAGTPYLLVGWLPYRLANHLPMILIALCAATLISRDHRRRGYAAWIIPAVLLFLLLRPVPSAVVGESTFGRFFAATDSVLFGIVGAATAKALAERDLQKRFLAPLWIFYGISWAVLAYSHQFGAACTAAGTIAGWTLTNRASGLLGETRAVAVAAGVLAAVLAASILTVEFRNRQHLPIGAFERSISEILEREGEARAMIAGPPYQLMLQAQTGHPIFSDMATRYYPSYMPSLAPSVARMYRSVYGIDLSRPEAGQTGWKRVWSARTTAEWIAAGLEFDFRYVIAPNDSDLAIEMILEGDTRSLYRIPSKDESTSEAAP